MSQSKSSSIPSCLQLLGLPFLRYCLCGTDLLALSALLRLLPGAFGHPQNPTRARCSTGFSLAHELDVQPLVVSSTILPYTLCEK